jgi:Spy/CpxP family protein refolding chaperone
MKKNIIGGLSAAVLSLAIVQAAPVYAMHQPDHKKGQCIMQKLERLKASLALTPDQEKQLKGIKEKHKDFMKKIREEKHAIKKEAHVIADAEQVDQEKLDKLAKRAGQLASDKLKNRVMAKHEINQVLTQEQKDKLKEEKGNMQKKMMQKKDN